MDNLADDLGLCGRRAVHRSTRAVLEPVEALLVVAALPPVEHRAADAVVPADRRDVAADLLGVLQHRQPALGPPEQVLLAPHAITHVGLLGTGAETVNNVCQFYT